MSETEKERFKRYALISLGKLTTERERGRSSIEMTAIGLLAWTTDSKKKMIYLQMCMGQTEKSLEALLAIKDVKIARMHPLHIMC